MRACLLACLLALDLLGVLCRAVGTETEATGACGCYRVELALPLFTLFTHGSRPMCGWVWLWMSLGDV